MVGAKGGLRRQLWTSMSMMMTHGDAIVLLVTSIMKINRMMKEVVQYPRLVRASFRLRKVTTNSSTNSSTNRLATTVLRKVSCTSKEFG
jgi:hypothetical protein